MGDGPETPDHALKFQSGFSLIEVVITLAILGLLMGIVTTNLRGAGLRNVAKAERGQLALVIDDLRTLSLATNLDLSLNSYLTAGEPDAASGNLYQGLWQINPEAYERQQGLATRLVLSQDLIIRRQGACSSGAGVYSLSNGLVLNFTVERLTCEVRLDG